jgi:hypothetical protein
MIYRAAPMRGSRDEVAQAGAEARRADALASVEGQRPGTRIEMFERTRALFALDCGPGDVVTVTERR